VPRLVPADEECATRNERSSRAGSLITAAGFSRTTFSRSALPGPRACMAKASTRRLSGALRSCRTSQFTLVVGRPSLGASTSTWQMIFPDRRSAVTWSGPTAPGIFKPAVMMPLVVN
jgi:hypothetical protein